MIPHGIDTTALAAIALGDAVLFAALGRTAVMPMGAACCAPAAEPLTRTTAIDVAVVATPVEAEVTLALTAAQHEKFQMPSAGTRETGRHSIFGYKLVLLSQKYLGSSELSL